MQQIAAASADDGRVRQKQAKSCYRSGAQQFECGRMRQGRHSATECGRVRQKHAKSCYRSVARPRTVEASEKLLQIRGTANRVRQSAAECGRVRQSEQSAAECGRVRQSAAECGRVRQKHAKSCYATTIKSQAHMGMQQQFDGDDARGDAAECGRVRQSAAETSVSVCMLSDALLRSRERGVEDSRIREGWRHPLKTELKSAKTKKRGFKRLVGSKNKKQY